MRAPHWYLYERERTRSAAEGSVEHSSDAGAPRLGARGSIARRGGDHRAQAASAVSRVAPEVPLRCLRVGVLAAGFALTVD